MIYQPAVQSEVIRGPAGNCQRNIIARYVHALEAIDFFKVAQTVVFLFAIREVFVYEIRNPPVCARPDRLRDQRVRRSLILMLNHREDMNEACLRSRFVRHQLAKANHFVAKKRPDENASVGKRSRVLARSFKVHSIVRKALSLTYRALVVDLADSLKQNLAERNLAKDSPLLLRL